MTEDEEKYYRERLCLPTDQATLALPDSSIISLGRDVGVCLVISLISIRISEENVYILPSKYFCCYMSFLCCNVFF